MSNQKINIDKELNELIFRFKRLKKAIDEENSLSPAQRAAEAAAKEFLKRASTIQEARHGLAEQAASQQLAKQLQQRGILGTRPPPRQPTDEEMFGHLVPNQQALEKMEQGWQNGINNWLAEATKPINSRFRTPEEEQAYWDSIKISGGGDDYGY